MSKVFIEEFLNKNSKICCNADFILLPDKSEADEARLSNGCNRMRRRRCYSDEHLPTSNFESELRQDFVNSKS